MFFLIPRWVNKNGCPGEGYTMGMELESMDFSTLGGWIATKAIGSKQSRYGASEISFFFVSKRFLLMGFIRDFFFWGVQSSNRFWFQKTHHSLVFDLFLAVFFGHRLSSDVFEKQPLRGLGWDAGGGQSGHVFGLGVAKWHERQAFRFFSVGTGAILKSFVGWNIFKKNTFPTGTSQRKLEWENSWAFQKNIATLTFWHGAKLLFLNTLSRDILKFNTFFVNITKGHFWKGHLDKKVIFSQPIFVDVCINVLTGRPVRWAGDRMVWSCQVLSNENGWISVDFSKNILEKYAIFEKWDDFLSWYIQSDAAWWIAGWFKHLYISSILTSQSLDSLGLLES